MNVNASPTREDLKILLMNTTDAGKHSAYQVLPTRLAELIGSNEAQINSRFERERFQYFADKLDLAGKSVLEIGPNAGFFTFEFLDAGCRKVTAFEGGAIHCQFIEAASKALGVSERLSVHNEYFDFKQDVEKHDIALLLNVVHHTGDDYENTGSIAAAKVAMLEQVNSMRKYTDLLVFQMGFCWKGKNANGIFENGTKAEMIDYVTRGTSEHWVIDHIAVAERIDDKVVFNEVNESNLPRNNALGEFLNRPIFIMHAKQG